MNIYAKPETEWPLDLPSAVFLPRAVLRIGQAKFGDEWTGKEPLASLEIFNRNERWGQAKQRQIRAEKRAIEWMDQPDAEKEKRRQAFAFIQTLPMRPLHGAPPLGPALAPEEWREIRDWTAAKNADAAPLVERFDAVCRAVVEQCLASLPTYYRAPNGEMKRLLESWWNLTPASWSSRFTTGQVNISEPMQNDTVNGGKNRCWLYVDAAGLEAWLQILEPPRKRKRADETAAEKDLRAICEAGGLPTGAAWRDSWTDRITGSAARKIWDRVAEDFPRISDPKGKAKRKVER